MSQSLYPTAIQRQHDGRLLIVWNDGERRLYRPRELRDHCPCATCREKRKQPPRGLPVLSEAETQPLRVEGMKPVGSYAYAVAFSDGHDTGIFTFELLRELGVSEDE